MSERQGMVDLHAHSLFAEMREHGLRDVLKVRVDDQPDFTDAAPPGTAKQSERRQRHSVVPGKKIDGVDLAPRLLNEIDAHLGSFGSVVEDAHHVRLRRGGNEYEQEDDRSLYTADHA